MMVSITIRRRTFNDNFLSSIYSKAISPISVQVVRQLDLFPPHL